MDAASSPGPTSSLRPTVAVRPLVSPVMWPAEAVFGYAPEDPYIRRYWTAVLGPGAVADLLRLMVAAKRKRKIPRPVFLADLAREGLVLLLEDRVWVRPRVPPLAPRHIRRLHPSLRAELKG